MKYWYLKGADVVGPLPVGEIVNDAEFSADTFVCPEHESENSEAWKPAEQYMQDFGYFLDPSHYAKSSEESAEPKERNEEERGNDSEGSLISERFSETTAENFSSTAPSVKESNRYNEGLPEVKPIFSKGEAVLPDGENPLLEPKPITEELPHIPAEPEKAPTEYNVYTERVNPNDLPAQSDFPAEETIHARSPLNAAMDDNLLDEIPASAVLGGKDEKIEQALKEPSLEAKEKEAELLFNEEETLIKEESSSPKGLLKDNSDGEHIASSDSLKPNPNEIKEEQAKDGPIKGNKDAVLPVEQERGSAGDSLETFTSTEPALHIEPDSEKSFRSKNISGEPITQDDEIGEDKQEDQKPYDEDSRAGDILSIDDEKEYGQSHSPNHGVIAEKHEADAGLLSVQDSVNSQFVKPAPTTSGKIISSADGRARGTKNKRNDLIYIMVMSMVVLVIVALMMMFTSEQNKGDSNTQTAEANAGALDMEGQISRSVIQGIDEGLASPEAPFASSSIANGNLTQSNGSVQDTSQDMARHCENLVRNYKLSDGTTIDERFGKIYGRDYQTRWSSNLLHGNTYVVEFFASKVRSEPIRYMFSVNANSGDIGGMNNAAVDLVGK